MVNFDDEALQLVIKQESWRATRSARGQACLADRALQLDDLQQELLILGFQLWQRFEWSRYENPDDGMRAFRCYIRRSFWRRLGRIQSKVRAALPLVIEVEMIQEETW